MIKYLFVLLVLSLSYACKTTKTQVPQVSTETVEEVIEEVEEEDLIESTVPDLVTNEVIGDCNADWKNRERLTLYRNTERIAKLAAATDGNIFVITQVNKNGHVIKAEIDEDNTTVKKDIWLNMALELVYEYEFEPDDNAPKIDCGTVKFFLSTM